MRTARRGKHAVQTSRSSTASPTEPCAVRRTAQARPARRSRSRIPTRCGQSPAAPRATPDQCAAAESLNARPARAHPIRRGRAGVPAPSDLRARRADPDRAAVVRCVARRPTGPTCQRHWHSGRRAVSRLEPARRHSMHLRSADADTLENATGEFGSPRRSIWRPTIAVLGWRRCRREFDVVGAVRCTVVRSHGGRAFRPRASASTAIVSVRDGAGSGEPVDVTGGLSTASRRTATIRRSACNAGATGCDQRDGGARVDTAYVVDPGIWSVSRGRWTRTTSTRLRMGARMRCARRYGRADSGTRPSWSWPSISNCARPPRRPRLADTHRRRTSTTVRQPRVLTAAGVRVLAAPECSSRWTGARLAAACRPCMTSRTRTSPTSSIDALGGTGESQSRPPTSSAPAPPDGHPRVACDLADGRRRSTRRAPLRTTSP